MRRLFTTSAVFACLLAAPAAEGRVIELGVQNPRPPASCPENCQAIGQVTGFQVKQGTVRHPFQVSRRGKIVAFTISLGKPNAEQIDFFTKLFAGPPRAQLTILRPGTKKRYRLTGHSEIFELSSYFGSSPTFALSRPLTVKKDYVVALTVPTWAPAFAVGLSNNEQWRSSRADERCDDVSQMAAQQRLGSLRTYGCLYKTARLLYTATFVPDPRPTTK
jgi:hypothetical protein